MTATENLKIVGDDKRVHKLVLPTRVVMTSGKVTGAERLLVGKKLQIGLQESDITVLDNRDEDKHAFAVLDFGKEIHGGIRLLTAASERQGDVHVRLTFGESVGEVLSNIGEKGACNDHSTRDFEVTLPIYSDLTFGQTGFRFVKIELLDGDGLLNLKAAVADFVYTDVEYKGSFRCSDDLINRIYDTAAYTCHLNLQNGAVWDGIKRDRLVWIGDSHPEMLTVKTVFGDVSCIEENLEFAIGEGLGDRWINTIPAYSLWWLIVADDWSRYKADYTFVTEHRDFCTELINRICGLVNDDGTDSLPSYFLDWPTAGVLEAKTAGVHGLLILALNASADMMEHIGENQLAKRCHERVGCLHRAHTDGGHFSQSNAILYLADAAGDEAIRKIDENGADGMSTYMGYYILTALANAGKTDRAVEIMKEYYGAMLSVGATTFWEDFHMDWLDNSGRIDEPTPEGMLDIHGDHGDFCYKGFRHSLCHGWASAVAVFISENILGVKVGYGGDTVSINPKLGMLDYAEGCVPTRHGIVKVYASKDAFGKTVVDFTVPNGVTVV